MMKKEKIKICLENNNIDDLCIELLEKLNKLDGIVEGQKLEIFTHVKFNLNDCRLEQKMQILHKFLELRVVFKFVSKS